MELPVSVTISSEEDTIKLAGRFSKLLKGGEVVALNGDLGAGKTFFVKHLLKHFGINNVNSPTFSIVNEYSGAIKVNHFDFYRINKIEELYDLGFEEYITETGAVTFIEWAEMLPAILPNHIIEINFRINEDYTRLIQISEKTR